jgi:FkbM family methyltransferase
MLIPLNELMDKYHLKFNGVLHLGCNEAQEAEMYDIVGIQKMVFIEALPDMCEKARLKVKNLNAKVIQACLSDREENVTFNIANNGAQSSSFLKLGDVHRQQHPEVDFVGSVEMTTKRLDEIEIEWGGLDYLVSDLQGVDLRAIIGMGDNLAQFKAATIEVNRDAVYDGCDMVEEVDRYMGIFGFSRVETKWVGAWGDSFYVKKI